MTRNRQHSRQGFSMLEIIIVIGIILLLMTISITVVSNILARSQRTTTQATIRKVSEVLNQRLEAFGRWMQREGYFDENNLKASGAWTEANDNEQLAKVLQRKKFMADHFPQLFSEQDAIPAPGGSHQAVTESAEALYWALTRGETFGEDSLDTDFFNSNEVRDTDNDGLLEFVDAWGNPLRYYRWPTRLIRPAPAGLEGTPNRYPIIYDPIATPGLFAAARGLIGSLRTNHQHWVTGTAYEVGDFVVPATPNDRMYRCTVAGTSGATEPSETVVGQEVSDATVTWEVVFDPLAQDGDDEFGATSNFDAAGMADFESNYHTVDTYHVPLIVSAGEDGATNPGNALGLYEPYDTTNYGNLAQPIIDGEVYLLDNVTNQNLRAGGN